VRGELDAKDVQIKTLQDQVAQILAERAKPDDDKPGKKGKAA
jgi:hypothetical protein